MKLFYSPFHDFVHKVLVVAYEAGLQNDIQPIATFPFRDLDGVWVAGKYDVSAINPLGKVPCLALDNGDTLYPSQVVAEFLDRHADTPLYPANGARRFDALRRLAIGDALFEFAVQMSMEGWRDPPDRRADLYTWLWPKIDRSLTVCETESAGWQEFDIGDAGLLQGISYLDAWATDRDDIPGNLMTNWRRRWPGLSAWFDRSILRPSVQSHYQQPFSGDTSPESFARGIAEVLEARLND